MLPMGFARAMAGLPDGDDRYDNLNAALVATIIACDTLHGRSVTADAIDGAIACVGAVARIDLRSKIRAIIARVIAFRDGDDDSYAMIGGQLHALGVYFHREGIYVVAIDIYDALLMAPTGNVAIRLETLAARGFACRLAQKFDEAEFSYELLVGQAQLAGSTRMALEGRLGLAKVTGARGDIPGWERRLRDMLPAIEAAGDPALIEKTYIDLAYTFGMRERYPEALEWSVRALSTIRDAPRFWRSLVNASTALRELGEHAIAVQLAEWGIARAPEAEIQRMHLFARYHLAIDAEDWSTAHRVRGLLRAHITTVGERVWYHEAVARTYASRGHWALAEQSLRRMIDLAQSAGMTEYVVRGDQALDDIRTRRVPARYTFTPKPVATETDKETVRIAATTLTALCSA